LKQVNDLGVRAFGRVDQRLTVSGVPNRLIDAADLGRQARGDGDAGRVICRR